MEVRMIGQYRLSGVLGKGGMGMVYAAEHTVLNRPAAVKVLLPRFSDNQGIVSRFFNEARAATAIRHPGIVEVYDVGWTDKGAAFIVMEHLQGETLRARRRRGPMRLSTALVLLRQIAGALGAAHAKGIVHRDLKPANIFLVPDPEVPGGERIKLLDFGIARFNGSTTIGQHKTRTGTLIGTPTYMSPEQCRGIAVDARADIYALGCIFFELCTGRPPFVCEAEGDILVAHIQEPPPKMSSLMSDVPREIEALVQRMLAKSPADRVQTAGELIQLIDAAKTTIHQVPKSAADSPTAPEISSQRESESTERQATPTSIEHHATSASTERRVTSTSTERRVTRDEGAPTHRERWTPRPPGYETASTVLATEGEETAIVSPTAVSTRRFETTLSSAASTLPRKLSPSPKRRSAVLGSVGGLALLGALALGFMLFRPESDEGVPLQAASPPPPAEPPTAAPPSNAPTPTPPEAIAPGAAPSESPSTTPPSEAAAETADSPPPAPSPSDAAPSATPATPAVRRDAPAPAASRKAPPASVRITIDSDPHGAAILLDDEVIGETPWSGTIPGGNQPVTFQLRRSGYQPKSLPVLPDKSSVHKVALEKRADSASTQSSPPSQPAPPPAASTAPQSTPTPAPSSTPPPGSQEQQGINPFK